MLVIKFLSAAAVIKPLGRIRNALSNVVMATWP